VTSNLDLNWKKADHRQGDSGTCQASQEGCKFFVIKILTCNSLRLKILQTIFADPAPVKPFKG
jgi:hypothetical protein